MARKNDHTNLWNVIIVMEVTGALQGERVCITGHVGLPRKQIQDIIRQAGGVVHEDVHSDTTILVSNGDWTAQTVQEVGGKKKSSKMLKAEENNRWGRVRTRIISEEMFCNIIIEKGQQSSMSQDA